MIKEDAVDEDEEITWRNNFVHLGENIDEDEEDKQAYVDDDDPDS